jgi:hypothetical protein
MPNYRYSALTAAIVVTALAVAGCGSSSSRTASSGNSSSTTLPASKNPPPPSPNLQVTISPTTGPTGTTVQIIATGCIDGNGQNHDVSFNWGGANPTENRTNPSVVVEIPATLSGDKITATHKITQHEAGFGGGTFFVQCGTTVQAAAFTVAN